MDGDGGASWYTADDYRRSTVYIGAFVRTAGMRVVLWQVPLGNTKMRAENNTWEHYQDNKVEWLIGDPTRAHLSAYAEAGVVAVLFGRGADGPTCDCDAAGDGVTNPAPINGNTGMSLERRRRRRLLQTTGRRVLQRGLRHLAVMNAVGRRAVRASVPPTA